MTTAAGLRLVAAAAISVLACAPAMAQTRLTVAEALELAFPECKIERRTLLLGEDERGLVGKACGLDFERGVVIAYVARDAAGKLAGTAYFDTHKVRTRRETLMVVVTPEATIARIEVLVFAEPPDYLPNDKWYAQFKRRGLDEELHLKRAIRGVTGATLTARATTDCARRVLAVHEVVAGRKARTKKDPPAKKDPSKKDPPAGKPSSRPVPRPGAGGGR